MAIGLITVGCQLAPRPAQGPPGPRQSLGRQHAGMADPFAAPARQFLRRTPVADDPYDLNNWEDASPERGWVFKQESAEPGSHCTRAALTERARNEHKHHIPTPDGHSGGTSRPASRPSLRYARAAIPLRQARHVGLPRHRNSHVRWPLLHTPSTATSIPWSSPSPPSHT